MLPVNLGTDLRKIRYQILMTYEVKSSSRVILQTGVFRIICGLNVTSRVLCFKQSNVKNGPSYR